MNPNDTPTTQRRGFYPISVTALSCNNFFSLLNLPTFEVSTSIELLNLVSVDWLKLGAAAAGSVTAETRSGRERGDLFSQSPPIVHSEESNL